MLINYFTILWVCFEASLIVRDRVRGRGKTAHDRGTIYFNILAIAGGLTTAGFIAATTHFDIPYVSHAVLSRTGFSVMLLGFAIRVWAVSVLGSSFRTTVETHRDQKVTKEGPYRLVRHPSYTGLLLLCTGSGIATRNWLSLIVSIVLPLAALVYRIRVEEEMLATSLGAEYQEYRKRTKRLIPGLW